MVVVLGLPLTAILVARKLGGAILIGVADTLPPMIIEPMAHVGPKAGPDGKVVNPNGRSLRLPTWRPSITASPVLGAIGHVSRFGGSPRLASSRRRWPLLAPAERLLRHVGTVVGLVNEGEILDEHGTVPHVEAILPVGWLAAVRVVS